jgi:hypothetical protein
LESFSRFFGSRRIVIHYNGYSKICGKHFTKSQYSRDPARLAELGYPGARAALKDDAIPDIPVVVNDDSPAIKKT